MAGMHIDKQSMLELAEIVATAVVNTLEQRGLINNNSGKTESNPPKKEKTAYQKTEQLLYNYNGFQRIISERQEEIEELRAHGVRQRCGAVGERVQRTPVLSGIVLPEESVENAVRTVQASVQGTVQAVALIDKCLAALENDPYYKIIPLRYFDGRTQEDIATEFGCSQVTISNNKNRLVRELSMRLFPNQVAEEMLK
jgi:RNA polymerase sigma factor (sigma-70 family)